MRSGRRLSKVGAANPAQAADGRTSRGLRRTLTSDGVSGTEVGASAGWRAQLMRR